MLEMKEEGSHLMETLKLSRRSRTIMYHRFHQEN
ncbi:unnamed protein product [Onchocerca flexuosa]|uniref:Uncharacterized protein n=1 Tax=Onchocerca flexuosa TaxID=387005 RepID=A0A183HS51_9BILA|nr:unnamed protein product [Onchocerca flexuosa]